MMVGGLLLLTGCASLPPAQVGHIAGSLAGAALVPGIGAPIGGLLGLLAGMAVQKKVDQLTEGRERRELAGQLQEKRPSQLADTRIGTPGEPVRVWVDETYRSGRLVPGHFEVRTVPSG